MNRDVARRGRGFERMNVRDGPPAAASRTTRHKAERHEEVRAHEDANSDTRLRDGRIVSADNQFFTPPRKPFRL